MRVLILEDEPLIALDLEDVVGRDGHEVVGMCETLAEMEALLGTDFDFAFLDVDLPDGKSFDLAARLMRRRVPFAFVSGSRRGDLPPHLRQAPFVSKPYSPAAIRNALRLDARLAG